MTGAGVELSSSISCCKTQHSLAVAIYGMFCVYGAADGASSLGRESRRWHQQVAVPSGGQSGLLIRKPSRGQAEIPRHESARQMIAVKDPDSV